MGSVNAPGLLFVDCVKRCNHRVQRIGEGLVIKTPCKKAEGDDGNLIPQKERVQEGPAPTLLVSAATCCLSERFTPMDSFLTHDKLTMQEGLM